MSRLLSAVGYHQPPVYYLPTFTLKDDWGTHTEVGRTIQAQGRALKDAGTWRGKRIRLSAASPIRVCSCS